MTTLELRWVVGLKYSNTGDFNIENTCSFTRRKGSENLELTKTSKMRVHNRVYIIVVPSKVDPSDSHSKHFCPCIVFSHIEQG